jgi:hypothetical protein
MSNLTSFGMYVPLDYETYKKIKIIKSVINVSVFKVKRWNRWIKKDPKNRTYKKNIVNDKGQKIGQEITGFIIEPFPCEIFFEKNKRYSHFGYNNQYHYNEIEIEEWKEKDIQKWLKQWDLAKKVYKEDKDVKPLEISKDKIEETYKKILDFYNNFVKKS